MTFNFQLTQTFPKKCGAKKGKVTINTQAELVDKVDCCRLGRICKEIGEL
jgi:isocitrate lyase